MNMKYKKLEKIAKGWSSYIWKVSYGEKIFVLKEVREKSPRKNLCEREGKMLTRANRVGVGPKVVEVNKKGNFVVMEFIRGKEFRDWFLDREFKTQKDKEKLYEMIKEIYQRILRLDEIGLSHNQLQVGKNILVVEKKDGFVPVIIDFEKATLKKKTKNLGQLDSFLFYNPHGQVAKKMRKIFGVKL
jgi:predicted Ser/Thr protein kinase